MSLSVVRRLVVKDLHLYRYPLLGLAVALPAVAIAVVMLGRDSAWSHMGLIFLNNSLIYLIFFLPMATVLSEKQKQTLPFLLSLPISYAEYTASKLVGSLGIFAVTSLGIALALPFVLAGSAELPDGALPLLVVALGAYGVVFGVTLAASLVTESYVWTTAAGLLSVALAFLFFPLLSSAPHELLAHWSGDRVVWDREVLVALGVELAVSLVVIAATFALQRRRKDFL